MTALGKNDAKFRAFSEFLGLIFRKCVKIYRCLVKNRV